MRQIFSSPRLENVEQVEKLLEEAGIQTRVTDRATWNRATKRDFSYTEKRHTQKWPAVWVVQADEYSKARQIMRDIGLLQTTQEAVPSYLPEARASATDDGNRVGKMRLVLLGGAILGATLVTLHLLGVI